MIRPFSILVSIIFLFSMFLLIQCKRAKRISVSGLIWWFLFWVGVLIFAWEPKTSDRIAKILGIGRGVDVIVVGAIIILYYFIFWLYNKIFYFESRLTEIVKELALLRHKVEEKGSKNENRH